MDPKREWYWNGSTYSEHRRVRSVSQPRVSSWLTTWPTIIVGFFLCLIPGLVLLWLRPTSLKVKGGVTAAALLVMIGLGQSSSAPTEPAVASAVPAAVASTVPAPAPAPEPQSATPVVTMTPTPTPTASAPVEMPPPPSSVAAPASGAAAVAAGGALAAGASSAKPAKGSALALVMTLPVKGRAPKTGYDREKFGQAWFDVDRNGCDTRNDMLRKYLTNKVMSGSCKVLSGTLADPYTATIIPFVRGGASEVDIDHMVALSDAWQKGAQQWPSAKRVAFANDPLNLQPTDAAANREKGDSDVASWLPPNKPYRCAYVARIVAVKKKYGAWVTQAERNAMMSVLSKCPTMPAPGPGSQSTVASNVGGATQATARPSPSTTAAAGETEDPRFSSCRAAKAAGFGPYVSGVDPEYNWYRDRDGDGRVCE